MPRLDRWQHLVMAADLLDQSGGHERSAAAVVLLRSVLEVFPASIDPVDDFEGHAVRCVARSLLTTWEGAAAAERGRP